MKVALLGYGVEGEASYRYFRGKGADITIVDENEQPKSTLPGGVKTILGPDALGTLKDFDVVVRTPQINPKKIITDGTVTSATKEFFKVCPAPIIGVTGSKGKGTTCSLIYEILKAAGRRVHLVGNIGNPALDALPRITPDDIVVFELSSFQLWDLEMSPHIAVLLMIEPDHLDVHDGMDDYIAAKAAICRFQTADDVCYHHPDNRYTARALEVAQPRSRLVRYGVQGDGGVYVKDGRFWRNQSALCSVEALRLPGAHNLDNACAAISAAMTYVDDPAAIERGLQAFTGLPHRLKFVREVRGVKYYDDSIATTPGSAIAAIRAFGQPKVLILGGSDKGADYDELVRDIIACDSMRAVVTVGVTGPVVAGKLKEAGFERLIELPHADSMKVIVDEAAHAAESGDVVILSPASASFDMFSSYAERGEAFVAAVEGL